MQNTHCPSCRQKFEEGKKTTRCPGCGVIHHSSCYRQYPGCASLRCDEGPELVGPAGCYACGQQEKTPAVGCPQGCIWHCDTEDCCRYAQRKHRCFREEAEEKVRRPVPHDFTRRMSHGDSLSAAITATIIVTLVMIAFAGKKIESIGVQGWQLVIFLAMFFVLGFLGLVTFSDSKRKPGENTLWQDIQEWP